VYLKTKILLLFLLLGLSLNGQSYMYSYTDPCTRDLKFITYDMSTPVIVAYYGQTKAFTYNEIQNGTFDNWISTVYAQYSSKPCQGILVSTTNTTTTNLTTNIVNTVLNLNIVTSFSSLNSSGTNLTTNVDRGSNLDNKNEGNGNSKTDQSKNPTDNPKTKVSGEGSNSGSSSPDNGTGGTTPNSGGSSSGSDQPTQDGNSTSQPPVDNKNGSNNGGGGSSGGNGGGGGGGGGTTKKDNQPTNEEVKEQKTDQQKSASNNVSKTTSKAKTETQKPAILLTGDIVGLQKTEDGSQDARGTMSYTRVKGDGTSSIGISADYMVNAKIGNVTFLRSWIGTNSKGNKHINLVSSGFSTMPGSSSNVSMYIRVNSLKKLTLIYGGAGVYGKLFKEPLITTLAISGFMYKGKLLKNLDATIIAAGVYSPYTKYYTADWFKSKPIIVPFFNFNYKFTKTFGLGLTGGTTYIASQNVINYQILLGAKLIL
jgi:hypothetical protein